MLMKLVVLLLTISVLTEAEEKSVIKCEGDGNSVSLSCPKNYAVKVTYANFGRTEEYSVVCPNSTLEGQEYSTECYSYMMLQYAQEACEGRRACTVDRKMSDAYYDSCEGTYKYLEVRYTCVKHFPDLDYCAIIESGSCLDAFWPLPTNDSRGPLTCTYTPIKANSRDTSVMRETGEPAVVRPAVVHQEMVRPLPQAMLQLLMMQPGLQLNTSFVECPASNLAGMYAAKVVISNSIGPIHNPAVIASGACYECKIVSDYVSCTDGWAHIPGCVIDDTCIPQHVLNPANPQQMCDRTAHRTGWTDIDTGDNENDQYEWKEPAFITFDACDVASSWYVKNASRAIAPKAAGGEGIDLTRPGAVFLKNRMKGTDHPFSFKFYLNFGNDTVEEDTTLLEWDPFLEIQRRPDDAILVKYTLVAIAEPRLVKKTVVIPAGGYIRYQEIGMKMQAVMKRRKRMGHSRRNKWKMIGLGYGKEEGVPTFSVYKNGEMVNTKLGNLNGTYLRMLPMDIVIKNALFSCMEFHDELKEPEYFTNLNITECQEHYATRTEDEFQDCGHRLWERNFRV